MKESFKWTSNVGITIIMILVIVGIPSIFIGILVYMETTTSDEVVYEDSILVCYGDFGDKDKPNITADYYCLDKTTNEMVCMYNWSRGSGSKPPQGCYL